MLTVDGPKYVSLFFLCLASCYRAGDGIINQMEAQREQLVRTSENVSKDRSLVKCGDLSIERETDGNLMVCAVYRWMKPTSSVDQPGK